MPPDASEAGPRRQGGGRGGAVEPGTARFQSVGDGGEERRRQEVGPGLGQMHTVAGPRVDGPAVGRRDDLAVDRRRGSRPGSCRRRRPAAAAPPAARATSFITSFIDADVAVRSAGRPSHTTVRSPCAGDVHHECRPGGRTRHATPGCRCRRRLPSGRCIAWSSFAAELQVDDLGVRARQHLLEVGGPVEDVGSGEAGARRGSRHADAIRASPRTRRPKPSADVAHQRVAVHGSPEAALRRVGTRRSGRVVGTGTGTVVVVVVGIRPEPLSSRPGVTSVVDVVTVGPATSISAPAAEVGRSSLSVSSASHDRGRWSPRAWLTLSSGRVTTRATSRPVPNGWRSATWTSVSAHSRAPRSRVASASARPGRRAPCRPGSE